MPGSVSGESRQQDGTPVTGVPLRRTRRHVGWLVGLAGACGVAVAATAFSPFAGAGTPAAAARMQGWDGTAGSDSGSPAERRIAAAHQSVSLHPKRVDGWNELALALARRARETGDPAFYREAWQATEQALSVSPGDLEARKLQVWVRLGQHEFPEAVSLAEKINAQTPDDVLTYGLLSDGYTELGRYPDAEKATQWMLDMRPGNVPALTRAAHLRELFGDHDGAVELMDTAYRRTPDAEVEDRAWILTQIASLSLLACRTGAAEKLLGEALTLFPEYHYALARMADVRQQQGRTGEAVEWRKRHVAAAPHPENEYELGVALYADGRFDEARQAWRSFETAARAEMQGWDSANVELIYYYADHAGRPTDALKIARQESLRRQDARTLEAHAWALHRNGRQNAARTEIDRVLAVGVTRPETLFHAAAIAAAQGDTVKARVWNDRSLSMCGASAVAADARHLQQSLYVSE